MPPTEKTLIKRSLSTLVDAHVIYCNDAKVDGLLSEIEGIVIGDVGAERKAARKLKGTLATKLGLLLGGLATSDVTGGLELESLRETVNKTSGKRSRSNKAKIITDYFIEDTNFSLVDLDDDSAWIRKLRDYGCVVGEFHLFDSRGNRLERTGVTTVLEQLGRAGTQSNDDYIYFGCLAKNGMTVQSPVALSVLFGMDGARYVGQALREVLHNYPWIDASGQKIGVSLGIHGVLNYDATAKLLRVDPYVIEYDTRKQRYPARPVIRV